MDNMEKRLWRTRKRTNNQPGGAAIIVASCRLLFLFRAYASFFFQLFNSIVSMLPRWQWRWQIPRIDFIIIDGTNKTTWDIDSGSARFCCYGWIVCSAVQSSAVLLMIDYLRRLNITFIINREGKRREGPDVSWLRGLMDRVLSGWWETSIWCSYTATGSTTTTGEIN